MKNGLSFVTLVFIVFFMLLYCSKQPTGLEHVHLEYGTVTDIDGNEYHTVKIGTQWWMAENLKVTHYRNSDDVPNVTEDSSWINLRTGAYCSYENHEDTVSTFGRLYNWYAVVDSRGLAPTGWHIPSDDEWQTLVEYLEGDSTAGGKMKETGSLRWNSPNTGATNESGFTALPGGFRSGVINDFSAIGEGAWVWSSTESITICTWCRILSNKNSVVNRIEGGMKLFGLSVRCIKD